VQRSLICTFLTFYDKSDELRREFAWAVKNCRTVCKGNYSGQDGRQVALEISRRKPDEMRAFLEGTVLVPVPTSGEGVDRRDDDLWSGRDLAQLFASEYGAEYRELLRRHTPIPKSSSGPGRRNLRRHINSIRVVGDMPQARIVLIDDIVTSGSTMCGCAEVLLAADPSATIEGFAAAYVTNDEDDKLRNFAAREYEWDGIDGRPRNRLVPSCLSNS